jgi:hypothetical protein
MSWADERLSVDRQFLVIEVSFELLATERPTEFSALTVGQHHDAAFRSRRRFSRSNANRFM